MKICTKCHCANEDACVYCVKCGTLLQKENLQQPVNPHQPNFQRAADPQQPVPQQPLVLQQAAAVKSVKKKNNIAIGALLLFLIVPFWMLACVVINYPSWATFKNIPFLAGVVILIFALRNAKKLRKKRILSVVCTVLCVLDTLLIAISFWSTSVYDHRLEAEVCAVQSLEEQLKDPGSLEIHEIAVCQHEDIPMFENYYSVYIDYSAANSFGAQVRDTATYTFFVEEDDSGNTHLYSTSTELPYFRDGGIIYSADEVDNWMFAWDMG